MNYIPNPQASGIGAYVANWYKKASNSCRYIKYRLTNKFKLTKINRPVQGTIVMLIALTMLFSMLFSISMIIIVGVSLFIINAGWQSVTQLFSGKNRPRLS